MVAKGIPNFIGGIYADVWGAGLRVKV